MRKLKSPAELEQLRDRIVGQHDPERPYISVCGGTGCHAYKCEDVAKALGNEIKQQGLGERVELKVTGCHGFCERGPLIVIYPEKIFYQRVTPADTSGIVSETVVKGKVIDRLLYTDPGNGHKALSDDDVSFYKKQQRLIFDNNRFIDPNNIEDYVAQGGYSALCKALFDMHPEEVLDEISKSALRGRGGAGFPTFRKWEAMRNAPSYDGIRYVICNADEGDPGAFMDRSLLEGNPHSVIEGMIIGAYAIGSHHGYVYVRNEYPLAVKNLGIALGAGEAIRLSGEEHPRLRFRF